MPIGDKKYVILSASEISHDQSDKVYAPHFFEGIATPAARNDTLFFVILSVSEISHHQSDKVYALLKKHPPGSLLRSARKDK